MPNLQRWRLYDFHIRPSFYALGNLYIHAGSSELFIAVYDPDENRFVDGIMPFDGQEIKPGPLTLSESNTLCGIGWDDDGLRAYDIDLQSGQTTITAPFGLQNSNRSELYYRGIMDGDWLYATVGNSPWELIAYNRITQECKILARTTEILGDHTTIKLSRVSDTTVSGMTNGVEGTIKNAAFVENISEFNTTAFNFLLKDGQIYARADDAIDGTRSPLWAQFDNWGREYQYWPPDIETTHPNIPIIPRDEGIPNTDGNVTLPYSLSQTTGTVDYAIEMYNTDIKMLREINDHTLMIVAGDYGQHLIYDLESNEVQRLHSDVSVYSMGPGANQRYYVSGYPLSRLIEYDFTQPIANESDNPSEVGILGHPDHSDSHAPIAGTVQGADGRIYNAGITYDRQRTGGGLGWYDPSDGSVGGMPLDERVFWMATALGNRYIVLSSKEGDDAEHYRQLMAWDTQEQTLAYAFEPRADFSRAGPLAEVFSNGLLIGHAASQTNANRGYLYGMNGATGEILWTKEVPSAPQTSISNVRNSLWDYRLGPDGNIWTFFGSILVRIYPENAFVEIIGRFPGQSLGNMLAFADNRLFMAGSEQLMEIPQPLPALSDWERYADLYQLDGAPLADHDGDGFSDFHEYAFFGNPTNQQITSQNPILTSNSTGQMQFSHIRRKPMDSSLQYISEWSDDLQSGIWHSTWLESSNITGDLFSYEQQLNVPAATTNQQQFFRVRVELP